MWATALRPAADEGLGATPSVARSLPWGGATDRPAGAGRSSFNVNGPTLTMPDQNDVTTSDSSRTTLGPKAVSAERRRRGHLRELCDEVLASFRVAKSKELISASEQAESKALLAGLTKVPLR